MSTTDASGIWRETSDASGRQPNPPEKVESLTREERAAWLEAHYAPNPEDAQCEIDALRMQLIQERARITALEAQVAGMGEALEAIETEAEREAVRWPHLKRVILIAARKARLAAAKEPS